MKTSKEMQLKIIDKMRENIENNESLLNGIEYYWRVDDEWRATNCMTDSDFFDYEHRIKPETVTINSVDIPKPLDISTIERGSTYYFPQCHERMYGELMGLSIIEYNVWYPYATKEEAIEASKSLFGIKE